VVKELMENALDAGATRIDVTLDDGGTSRIVVSDDGAGIEPDDLPLAVAPHATSKIRGLDDLAAIRTMGFRGEALASIASVSRLRITSRPRDRLEAARIDAADRDVGPVEPCAAPPGTSVEVAGLFHNVPARRKYLRTVAAELGHVSEQIARLALAHPQTGFTQTHQGRVLRRLPPTADRRGRIADFFGAELAAELIHFHRREPDLAVEGWFAPPAASRASGKWQYVFLNGRFIRDRDLSGFVLREAFRGLIEPARYPVAFLFLAADPAAYDVNVHPTKIEVRWRDAGRVKSQVLAVLREALLSRDLTPALRTTHRWTAADPREADGRIHALAAHLREIPPTVPGPHRMESRGADSCGTESHGADLCSADSRGADSCGADSCGTGFQPVDSAPRAIQIHNTYLVCETPDGLLIVDQHALHERILFEELAERVTRGPLESQRLLLPETLEVSPEQLAALDGAAELLARLGLDLQPFGARCIAVHAAPSLLRDAVVADFARDLLDKLIESDRPHPAAARNAEALLNDVLAMMACKAAVKAGDALSGEAIAALLERRHLVDRASNCPHGRPTTLRLTVQDLERQFKRS
jgi:DNA mismatch repair protein MutL